LEELEDKFEQLTLRNEQLEMTMSKLLEKWAQEKQLASDAMQECRRKVHALQAKCQLAPEILKKAVKKAQQEGNKFALMEKGVYTEEAHQLCRVLVQAGCSQAVVGDVIEEVLSAAGISVHGPKMSERTVAHAVLEGGVMADIQMGYEIAQAEGLTVSSDGTTHKNINFEARHVHMPVATENPAVQVHKTRLVGVDSATDHSSKTQATGWTSKIQEKLDIYNQSPLAQRSKSALQLADFFVRLHGTVGDHAKDQIKLAELLKEMKQEFTERSLGEERLIEMSIPDMLKLLSQANIQKIADAGGQLKWAALSEAERLQADAEMMSAVVLKLGHDAYANLPNEEKQKFDLFVRTGCAMHKDLNCFKGGSAAMADWWSENSVAGPILLANKDNAAVLEQADDAEEYGAVEQRAHDVSSGGGVKLASLAGMIFNNKNDKVGQQGIHQQFFASRGVKVKKFPATNNN